MQRGWIDVHHRVVLYTIRTSSASPHGHSREIKGSAMRYGRARDEYVLEAQDALDHYLQLSRISCSIYPEMVTML
jgi:hypothetical protein